ncbi:glycosyltransferase family 4 protein [Turicimonas muris]|uniref:glycosyltransferase family 4 protein n=1 Tax=Turicimonas muris TaxID=1796652 RepID=UPI00248BD373|nr:glycosyltransferase family 4 protein [Turicimonas muris]
MAHQKKNILLCVDSSPTQSFNLEQPKEKALFHLGGNSGNTVFQHATHYMINQTNSVQTAGPMHAKTLSQEEIDRINSTFDLIIILPANTLSVWGKRALTNLGNNLSRLKIPTLCIGLGAQAGNGVSIDSLYSEIKDEAVFFLKSLLRNGKVSLRGEFTGAFLERLGFRIGVDFDVNGCPSMYLFGENLHIEKKEHVSLKPAFNGFRFWNEISAASSFDLYPGSIFVCQEEFYNLLNRQEPYSLIDKKYLWDPSFKFDTLNREGRIKLYTSLRDWYSDLRKLSINFSFGCRIHGNIVPLLGGIPAVVDAFDSRTLELAQFFGIPHIDATQDFMRKKNYDFEKLYSEADFTLFNSLVSSNFQAFKRFMFDGGVEIQPLSCSDLEEGRESERIQGSLVPSQVSTEEEPSDFRQPSHIVLVAHEFGCFKGNGGIASCLEDMVRSILNSKLNLKVSVICLQGATSKDISSHPLFNLVKLSSDTLDNQGKKIAKIIAQLKPDYVEFADYLGLGMETLLRKNEKDFSNIVFSTDCHTASQECFVWSTRSRKLPEAIKAQVEREKAQLFLSDILTSPSKFLAKYVEKNYCVPHVFHLPHVLSSNLPTKPLKKRAFPDLKDRFVVSNISRFEGRKNIHVLVDAFLKFLDNYDEEAILILAGTSVINPLSGKDYRQEIIEMIPEFRKGNILIFDYVGEKEKKKIYEASDLGIMASTFENFPVSMTEYVMNGVPILCSRYCGCTDFLENTYDFASFNPFESGSLLKQLVLFSSLSKQKRETIAWKQREELIKLTTFKRSVIDKLRLFKAWEKHSSPQKKLIKCNSPELLGDVSENEVLWICDKKSNEIFDERAKKLEFSTNRITCPLVIVLLNENDGFDFELAIEKGRGFILNNILIKKTENLVQVLRKNRSHVVFIRATCEEEDLFDSSFLKEKDFLDLRNLYE